MLTPQMCNRCRSIHAANDDVEVGGVGGHEGGALHEIAAGVRHRERFRNREIVNRPGTGVAVRVGGKVTGDVFDQLARIGANRGGEQYCSEIRSAASE